MDNFNLYVIFLGELCSLMLLQLTMFNCPRREKIFPLNLINWFKTIFYHHVVTHFSENFFPLRIKISFLNSFAHNWLTFPYVFSLDLLCKKHYSLKQLHARNQFTLSNTCSHLLMSLIVQKITMNSSCYAYQQF